MHLADSLVASIWAVGGWYEALIIAPLKGPVDSVAQERRKYFLGGLFGPCIVLMILTLLFNAVHFSSSSGECFSSVLYGSLVQAVCGAAMTAIYFSARWTKRAGDLGIFCFCWSIFLDGTLVSFQLPANQAPLIAIFMVIPLLICLVAASSFFSDQKNAAFYLFLAVWFGLQSYSVAVAVFDGSETGSLVLGCTAPSLVSVYPPLIGVAFFVFAAAIIAGGHLLLELESRKVTRINSLLQAVTGKLAQCRTDEAVTSLQEYGGEIPDAMRRQLLSLVDRIVLCEQLIIPAMQAELRMEVRDVAQCAASQPAVVDSLPVVDEGSNPLILPRGGELQSTSTPSVLSGGQPPFGPRVHRYKGALMIVYHRDGCPLIFRDLMESLTELGAEVLSVTFSELIVLWPMMTSSAILSTGSDDSNSVLSDASAVVRTEGAVVSSAEDAARRILEAWPIPALRLAISLGEAWGTTVGSAGQQRTFLLGGRDLEHLSFLPSLCEAVSVRAVVTLRAANYLGDRCIPFELVKFAEKEPAEPVFMLIPGLAKKEFGHREVRARALVLRKVFDAILCGGATEVAQQLPKLRSAARVDRRLGALCLRAEDLVADPTPERWAKLFRRPDPYVLHVEELSLLGNALPGHAAAAIRSPEEEEVHSLLTAGAAPAPADPFANSSNNNNSGSRNRRIGSAHGHKRVFSNSSAVRESSLPENTIVLSGTPAADDDADRMSSSSTASTASLATTLTKWQRSRFEQADAAGGLIDMFIESEKDADAEEGDPRGGVPLVIKDAVGRKWRRSVEVLGCGAFSEVYSAIGTYGQPVALKCVDLTSPRISATASEVVKEVETMQNLRHRNVVGYISYGLVGSYVVLVMECVAGGSLRHMLELFGKLPIGAVRRYMRDALHGLRYLHEHGVTHCDIKPHNLLLTGTGTCKVADFGSSVNTSFLDGGGSASEQRVSDGTDAMKHLVVNGTPLYMSPEACRGESSPAQDIWSIGVTALELLAGELQWTDSQAALSPARFVRQLGNDPLLRPVICPELPPDAQAFLAMCLERDPTARPSALSLLESPFLKQSL